jgi:2-C-methyl-D-erythritol 4-phosphate cytidylyltransferase
LKINLIEGEWSNIKITFPVDLIVAEKLIGGNSPNS